MSPAERSVRRAALAGRIADIGLAAAVVTDPRDLEYLTGYDGTTVLGPNPFCGGTSAALVLDSEAAATLVVGQHDDWLVSLEPDSIGVHAFETFTDLAPLRPRNGLARGLLDVLGRHGITNDGVGYQGSSLPAATVAALAEGSPGGRLADIDREIGLLRLRKSPAELEAIRHAVAICDAAQLAVTEQATPGQTSDELASLARSVVERATEMPTPIVLEVSYGGDYGGDAAQRPLREGDLLLSDIAPRVAGYWGDSCDTRAVGTPTKEQRTILRTVLEALEIGTEAVRPGVTAHDVDAAMRAHVGRRFPVYEGSGGHGVGLDYHESPRLIPGEAIVLQPGMVLAIEPGVYLERVSARLEHVVYVTPQGCEVLSRHLAWHRDGAPAQ